MTLSEQIGAEIAAAREKQKRSKREVAIACGVQPQRYGEWESGEGNITAASLEKVAAALKKKVTVKLK